MNRERRQVAARTDERSAAIAAKRTLIGLLLTAATVLGLLAGARAQTGGDAPEPAWLTAVREGKIQRSRDLNGYEMGAVPSSPASVARSPRFVVRGWGENGGGNNEGGTATRPSSLILLDYLPPVLSQGHQGSCVAWSSGYYCYTYAVAKQRHLTPERIAANPKLQFSPAFLYHLGNHGKDTGMQITTAFEILREQGCASLAEMPYDATDFTSPPNDAANEHAARYKARNSGLLFRLGEADPEKLKVYLNEARQPFVTAIPILKGFPMSAVDADYVYKPNLPLSPQDVTGMHAVTIIGYDDARHAFRMVNSWGTRWGDSGFLWLDEDFIRNCAMDGCSVVAGGLLSRDPKSGGVQVAPHIAFVTSGGGAGDTPKLRARGEK